MSVESAITEEQEVIDEPIEDLGTDDDYDIQEPADDEPDLNGEDGTNSIKVPQIDNEEIAEDKEKQTADDKDAQVETQKPEKVEKTEPEKEVALEKISDELIEKAKSLGLKDDDIKSFTTSKQLETICDLIAPNIEKADSPQQKTDDNSDTDQQEFNVKLDKDLYDPALCDAFDSTVKQINTIKQALDTVLNSVTAQNQKAFVESFDGMLNSLGDEYGDVFGKGSFSEIDGSSDFYKNRCKLLDEMDTVAAGYLQSNKPMPPQKQLFDRAVNAVFGDKAKATVRKEISNQLNHRSSQMISRPASKTGNDKGSPEKRATSVVNEKLRQFGAFDDAEVNEDF